MRKHLIICGTILAVVAALLAVPVSASAAVAPAQNATSAAAAPSPDSVFNFCNDTGGRIGCFTARLHFVDRFTFQLRNVNLVKGVCDNRTLYADINNQDCFLDEFNNTRCHTTRSWPGPITISYPYGTQFVQVALYSCNFWGCSSVVWSLKHWNPYY